MGGFRAASKVLAIAYLFQLCGALRPWNDLRIKYSANRNHGYYKMPLTVASALIEDYVKVQPEEDLNLPLDFYCFLEDPCVCLMYDKKGHIAGVQTSFLKDDVDDIDKEVYNLSTNVNFKNTNFFNIPAYSVRVFFTNPEELTETGRQCVNETAEGLWVYLDGKLFEIPRNQPLGDRFGDFYRQACIRSMGLHYFYKMDKNLDKDCKDLFPMSVLYERGSLIGYGIATVGRGSRGPSRNWYEYPGVTMRELMAPNRAACLDDLSEEYGVTLMHVYLVEKPWNIGCTLYDWILLNVEALLSMIYDSFFHCLYCS